MKIAPSTDLATLQQVDTLTRLHHFEMSLHRWFAALKLGDYEQAEKEKLTTDRLRSELQERIKTYG